MSTLRRTIARFRNVFRPERAETDLEREIASHVALLADEFERRGLSPGDARVAARRAFDGVEQTKDRQRDARSFTWLDDARWDVRYAARLLTRNPLFTLTAALSLAIGIGANTTIFTIASALLFGAPAGVVDPHRIVDIGGTVNARAGRGTFGQVSYLNYLEVRQRATTLASAYAYHPVPQPMSLASPSGADRLLGTYVSANYFSALGVRPAIGQLFAEGDDRSTAASIVVLNHRFWTRHFNSDPSVVGRLLTINSQPYTVVGVAAEGFRGTSILVPDAWLPVTAAQPALLASRNLDWPLIGGRLKPGVSIAQAAAEINAIGLALEREYPDDNRGKGLRLVPATPIPGNVLPVAAFLSLLTGIVSLVLVIACANVAGVLLARGAARRREIAVRLAMGAGRSRLIRQLLTETTMLFVLGGAVGLLLARGMTTLLVSMLPTLPLPVDVSLPLDARVVLFTAGLSLIAAVFCGLVPALHASRADVVSTMKDAEQGPSDRLRLRQVFVVAQVAVSILLVVGALLFVRALNAAGSINRGFVVDGVEVTSLDLSLGGYSSASARVFTRELIARVRALPAVERATVAATSEPIGDGRRVALVSAPGVTSAAGDAPARTDWTAIDPGYFSTLKIPLIGGRDFDDADVAAVPQIAIVGEAAAKRLMPGVPTGDVVGQSITLQPSVRLVDGGGGRVDRSRGDPVWTLRIVGIARDVKYLGPGDTGARLFVYIPLAQTPFGSRVTIVTRTAQGQRVAAEVRGIVGSLNPNLPIISAQTLADWTAVSLLPQRIAASVSGALGAVGFLLAAIGIYGVTAYAVARRTREIGIRVALGAHRRAVVRMVLREGMTLAMAGSALGLLSSAAIGRLLATFLLGVGAVDPLIFLGAVTVFAAIALVACYVPARRAIAINAVDALRAE